MTDTAKSFTDFDPLGRRAQGDRQLQRRSVQGYGVIRIVGGSLADSATPESVSPEAAAVNMPAPVSPDAAIPQPSADAAVTPEAPQPQEAVKSDAVKSGSGA